MKNKLKLSRWYVLSLESRHVYTDQDFSTLSEALDWIHAAGYKRHTAHRGCHLLEHEGRPWIIPEATRCQDSK